MSKDCAGFVLVARQHETPQILDKHALFGASGKKTAPIIPVRPDKTCEIGLHKPPASRQKHPASASLRG
jgi:hypothetical protein